MFNKNPSPTWIRFGNSRWDRFVLAYKKLSPTWVRFGNSRWDRFLFFNKKRSPTWVRFGNSRLDRFLLFDKNQFPEVELFDDYDYWEKKIPLSVITEKWVLENLTFKELKYFFKSYLRAYFETNHSKIQMKALDLLKIEKEKREDTSKDEKKSKRTNHR